MSPSILAPAVGTFRGLTEAELKTVRGERDPAREATLELAGLKGKREIVS